MDFRGRVIQRLMRYTRKKVTIHTMKEMTKLKTKERQRGSERLKPFWIRPLAESSW